MVKERMDLLELMRKRGVDGDVDFLREALRVLVEEIMEADVSPRTGAGYGERNPERVTQRNGYRSRAWDTRVGTMELQIPKLREGSYFPSLLEPWRRSERALLAVIQQAYVEGVSTRRVDDLVKALGCEGISKSQVSRICQELDGVVESFLGRPLDGGPYPYLWLDALTQKVREAGRIVNVSVAVATAVNSEGRREIIGMDVGTSEDGTFWLAFLRSLSARGLGGVKLVVSVRGDSGFALYRSDKPLRRCVHRLAELGAGRRSRRGGRSVPLDEEYRQYEGRIAGRLSRLGRGWHRRDRGQSN